jgi:hypothetical protein
MLDTVLKWLGAGDQALTTMGPIITWMLSCLFGGSLAQWVKYPISRKIADSGLYDWTVRAIAIASTTAFAHILSESVTAPFEVGFGLSQPLVYHLGRAAIRKWIPWAEAATPLIGSASPPQSAYDALAKRQASKE